MKKIIILIINEREFLAEDLQLTLDHLKPSDFEYEVTYCSYFAGDSIAKADIIICSGRHFCEQVPFCKELIRKFAKPDCWFAVMSTLPHYLQKAKELGVKYLLDKFLPMEEFYERLIKIYAKAKLSNVGLKEGAGFNS